MNEILAIKLDTGRTIHATNLFVGFSYSGHLEGRITNEVNEWALKQIDGQIASAFRGMAAKRIGPTITTGHRGEPRLGSIFIAADFVSYAPAKNTEAHASSLVIVWWQDSIHPLVSPENELAIKAISWNDCARDFEW